MTDPRAWSSRLHIESSGPPDAGVVVLLHGWGSHAALMRPLARILEPFYRVIAIDLPGHGASPPPPEPWGVPEYAACVAGVLETAGVSHAPFVGHSNGGRIALYMASEPDLAPLIDRLVLISPSGIRARRSVRYYLRSSISKTLRAPINLLPGAMKPYGLDWLRHTWIWPLLGSSDFRQLQGVMRETFVKTVNTYLEDRLARVHVPALVLWGDRDTDISRRQMDTLVAGLPEASLVVLPGAGHYGYIDRPVETAQALLTFLAPSPVPA